MGLIAEVEEVIWGVPVDNSTIAAKTIEDDKLDVLINPPKTKITARITLPNPKLPNKIKPEPKIINNILSNKANS